jgi:hypothetical protein
MNGYCTSRPLAEARALVSGQSEVLAMSWKSATRNLLSAPRFIERE